MPSLSDLLKPIPGPNPSGEDTRYTGVYDQIKEARREELDLPQGAWQHERKTADWDAVADLCTDALINQTKDLQIAAWLTEALVHRDGFPGVTQGLCLLGGLIEQFWTTLYPRSEEDELEFRAGSLEWVGSRLEVAVKSIPLTPAEADARAEEIDLCETALHKLQATCDAHFGNMAPRLSGLLRSLETAQHRVQGWITTRSRLALAEPAPDRARRPTGVLKRIRPPGQRTDTELPLDSLHFTITAPPAISPASSFLVSLWVHSESQRAAVIDRACRQHQAPDPRGILSVSKGPVLIARGAILTIRLEVTGARVADPEDTVLWTGEIGAANFIVTLPANAEQPTLPGKAVIYLNGVQVAKVQFVLQVQTPAPEGVVPTTETRVRKAFASYASPDRDEVLGRLQGIRKAAPELEIFFDILTLRSGQSWEGEIERLIPASDVFYLFWSLNASSSSWVEREWRTALRTGRPDFIDPVPLQSPEEAPPPPELASLHFNDWMLAFQRRKTHPVGRTPWSALDALVPPADG